MHLLAVLLLMQSRQRPPPAPPRAELRIAVEIPKPRPQSAAPAARHTLTVVRPEFNATPSPEAIALPALEPANEPVTASTAAASAPPAKLDLSLPRNWKPDERINPAQQAVHDPRANSPRLSAEQRMAKAIGAGSKDVTWERIELADGGYMLRGSNGQCVRVVPNLAAGLGLMDAPMKSGSCFTGSATGVHHERPR